MNEIIDIVDIPRKKKKSFKQRCKNFINKVFIVAIVSSGRGRFTSPLSVLIIIGDNIK